MPTTAPPPAPALPERILCFGDGRFLRAFAGEAIERANRAGLAVGRLVCTTNTPRGSVDRLNAQGGAYHVVTRGIEAGRAVERITPVTSVSRGLNAFSQWPELVALARSPDLAVLLSNTTEAGIAWLDEPYPAAVPPRSFPARVAALLHARFLAGRPGLLVVPCELIEANGQRLRELVLRHAAAWDLPPDFAAWVGAEVRFRDTLVDRIVPGEPVDAPALRQRLGVDDQLLVSAEPYHLWAIQGEPDPALPLERLGLASWVGDLRPVRERKVRVLNGCHTALSAVGLLAGAATVGAAVADPLLSAYLRRLLDDEVLPGLVADLGLPRDGLAAYAATIGDRFANPNLEHRLDAISLNAVSKYAVRLGPTVRAAAARGRVAGAAALALAALVEHHAGGHPHPVRDDAAALARLAAHRQADPRAEARAVCADAVLWGGDLATLPGFADAVGGHLARLRSAGSLAAGTTAALTSLLSESGHA